MLDILYAFVDLRLEVINYLVPDVIGHDIWYMLQLFHGNVYIQTLDVQSQADDIETELHPGISTCLHSRVDIWRKITHSQRENKSVILPSARTILDLQREADIEVGNMLRVASQ